MKYKVEVIRTAYDSMMFDVEAKNEEQAQEIAIDIACNASWGSGNADYEVESIQPIK
jgi:hypothetical protein